MDNPEPKKGSYPQFGEKRPGISRFFVEKPVEKVENSGIGPDLPPSARRSANAREGARGGERARCETGGKPFRGGRL